jgi:hypothetical protein
VAKEILLAIVAEKREEHPELVGRFLHVVD